MKLAIDEAPGECPLTVSSASARRIIPSAWIVMLLVSSLPEIVFIKTIGKAPFSLAVMKLGQLLLLTCGSVVWKPLRSLRNYWIVLFAFVAFGLLRPQIDFTFQSLQRALGGSTFEARMQPEQAGKFAVALAIIGTLLALGYSRREMFLTSGNLRAPITPVKWLGFPKADPWLSFGLQWGFYIAAALFAFQFFTFKPGGSVLTKALPMMPSILFYAALNAFNEEVTYRVPLLATLESECGSKHALWISASFFGIAHYFGMPGGIPGVMASTFLGWMLGKAMIETRGLFWAWWIHFLSDIAIFYFMAASLTRST